MLYQEQEEIHLCNNQLLVVSKQLEKMVEELEAHVDDINYDVAIAREKLVRHDVMSHVYAYGQQCPKAAGIIHLGATSCYVGDNTDIIVMRQGLELVRKKLIGVLATAGLHLYKRNTLISIAGGTAVYMLMVQCVFV